MEEIINLRGRTSKTFDRGGAKRRHIVSIGTIHYKDNYADDKEQWKDIDLTIRDGKLTTAPYELTIDGTQITFRDKRTGSIAIIKPVKVGARIANEEDFSLVPFSGGIKLKRIVKSKDEPTDAEFDFDLQGEGIRILATACDADDEPVPVICEVKDGKLIERIDSKVLETVKYPLRIDPTLTVQPSAKDAYLAQNAPDTNYGERTYIAPRAYSEAAQDRAQRCLLEFDISEIPADQNLTAGTLWLYYYNYEAEDPSGLTIWAYKLTRTDWVEAQATWNKYKTDNNWTAAGGDYVTSDPVGGSTTFPAGYEWMSWNVLAIAEDAYSGEIDVELLVRFDDEGPIVAYGGSRWYSREYTDNTDLCPKLVIDYEPAETTYDTLVGAKTSWAWDKCDYEGAEECPVGLKTSWAWAAPESGVNQTMQGAKGTWAWDTT